MSKGDKRQRRGVGFTRAAIGDIAGFPASFFAFWAAGCPAVFTRSNVTVDNPGQHNSTIEKVSYKKPSIVAPYHSEIESFQSFLDMKEPFSEAPSGGFDFCHDRGSQAAWGRFWGRDPKKGWALVTWLFYSAYLYLRSARGRQGRKSAWLVVLGFLVVMFAPVGVNPVIAGLYSYAGTDPMFRREAESVNLGVIFYLYTMKGLL